MALVAYGNSDSSEYEDDDNENVIVVTLNNKKEPLVKPADSNEEVSREEPNDDGPSLFNFLPQPTNKPPAVVEEDDEFLHKKDNVPAAAKPKAKITVPSLSDFKDVDTILPTAKPRTNNGKKSGLLSMLPQPKNAVTTTTKSLIPHVLTQKPSSSSAKKKSLPTPMKKPKAETKIINDYSDDSDNDEVQNDFFSINKPVDIPIEDIPLDIDQKEPDISQLSEKKEFNIESYFKPEPVENKMELKTGHETSSVMGYAGSVAPESSSYSNSYETNESAASSNHEEVVLDDEAIMKLCGTRGKRKREDIQIVDVNQQEVLADAREWLLKGLMDDTTKRVSASKKKGNEPTSQQRRKHQITYLAHQAKANEAELQNQWANNRMSKRQTQSKYGF